MIADWWPDEWDYPVGYHVTVPCEADDAAYRSFHQAFVYDGVDSGGVPVMRYEQDLVRDGDLVDTNFGGNGLCRTTNYAMETVGTNLMRYCTRQLTSANVAPGFNVTAATGDVSSRASVHALVEQATSLGEVSGVIHAAGVSPSQASPENLLES